MARGSQAGGPAGPAPRPLVGPVFSQPEPTADPTKFRINHPSDDPAYKEIDQLNKEHLIKPLPLSQPARTARTALDAIRGIRRKRACDQEHRG
jgi:hypothetical protein